MPAQPIWAGLPRRPGAALGPRGFGRLSSLKEAAAGPSRCADCSLQTNLGISVSQARVPTKTGKPSAGGGAPACRARCTCRKSRPLRSDAVSRITIRGRGGQTTWRKIVTITNTDSRRCTIQVFYSPLASSLPKPYKVGGTGFPTSQMRKQKVKLLYTATCPVRGKAGI